MTYPISTFSANRTVVIKTTGTTTFAFAAGAGNVTINGRPGTQMGGLHPEGIYTIVKTDANIHVCMSVTATLIQRLQ
jgi:glutamate synthase domain-containing protein 3